MNEMKQMFRFCIVTAAIAASMFACSSEEVLPGVQPVPERSSLTIVINNNEATTKAVADNNAIDQETEISSISLFIFGSATEAEKDTTFTTAGSNPFAPTATDNEFKATLPTAPVGTKSVYVGVNLPQALHNLIKTQGVSAVRELSTLTDLATLYPATGGFPMFSDGTVSPVVTIAQGTPTILPVNVKRFVSKVTMETNAAFEANTNGERTANGATVDATLSFSMGQVNTKFFPYPKKSGGIYIDPNYSATVSGTAISYQADFINLWTGDLSQQPWPAGIFDNFRTVNTTSEAQDIKKLSPSYVLENTTEKKLKGELTYATVKAKFTPKFIHTYAAPNVTTTANTKNDFQSLYVFNDGGLYYYFTDKAQADAFKADRNIDYRTYQDCTCFYTVYLSPNNDYNVLRNEYYKITVNKIVRLGNYYPGPSPDDSGNEQGGEANIQATVEVQPWNMISQDINLGEKE
jgi:hypothetical protein